MASDNDWYSDESDETFYRERESNLYNTIVNLHNSICFHEHDNQEIPKGWEEELKRLIDKYEQQEGFNPITGKVCNG